MALSDREQRLSAIAANIPGTVYRAVLHPDGTMSLPYINPGLRELTGLEPNQVMAEPQLLLAIIHPDDRAQFARILEERYEMLDPVRHEYRIITTSGQVKWVYDSTRYFRMDNGDVVVDGVTLDISDRKQATEALQQSEARLQAILDNSPTAIYLKDLQGRYLTINRECERFSGLSKEQTIGKTDYEILPQAIADKLRANDREVLATQTPLIREEEVQTLNGLRTYITVKFPIFDTTGVSYAVCGISTDITERKQAEVALQRLNEELEIRVRERTTELEQLNDILIDEASLRQREQEFKALVENAPDVIARYDRELRHLYVNPAVELATGLPPEAFIGKTNLELGMSEEAVSLWCQTLQTVFEAGIEQSMEFDFLTSSGLKHYQIRLVPEFAPDGSIETVLGISRDITTSKQAEAEIRASEERFRTSVENMLDCFGIYSAIRDRFGKIIDFKIEYLNAAACENNGMAREEMIGKGLCELLPSHRTTGLFDEYCQVVETGNPLIKDELIYEDVFGEVRLSRVFDVRAAQLGDGLTVAWRNITERKQAEEALRESEERFRQLAENINEIFWMSSLEENQIIYVSPAYEEIWGCTCESLYERRMSWIDTIHPEDRDRVLAAVEKQVNGEYDEQYRIVRPDGSIRWIHDRAFPVRDARGQVYRIAGITEDITSRKQAEEEIYNMLQRERELSDLKSRFVSMTSHEFRTPLTMIQSSAELLERYRHRFSEEKQLIHLHRIKTAVERMTQMLNDILLLGKAEAGKLEFNPAPVELAQLCRNLVEELQLAAKNPNAIVFIERCQSIPANIDEKLLRQILTNLLSNAIKYSPSGSTVQFNLTCRDGNAIFQIQDQGIGIPPKDRVRLFESFHRATNVGTIQGTGLGLAIVKQCVDLHGGGITVESEVGKGTTFTVTLPLSD
jgi:PAS domain S-box-containing protein